jgi:hypothetical protein
VVEKLVTIILEKLDLNPGIQEVALALYANTETHSGDS